MNLNLGRNLMDNNLQIFNSKIYLYRKMKIWQYSNQEIKDYIIAIKQQNTIHLKQLCKCNNQGECPVCKLIQYREKQDKKIYDKEMSLISFCEENNYQ